VDDRLSIVGKLNLCRGAEPGNERFLSAKHLPSSKGGVRITDRHVNKKSKKVEVYEARKRTKSKIFNTKGQKRGSSHQKRREYRKEGRCGKGVDSFDWEQTKAEIESRMIRTPIEKSHKGRTKRQLVSVWSGHR